MIMGRKGGRRIHSGVVLLIAAALLVGGAVVGSLIGWFRSNPATVGADEESPIIVQSGSGSPLDAPTAVLPVMHDVPDFTLQAIDGSTVRRADLIGGPWAVEFIFTSCGGICPKMSGEFSRLQTTLPADLRATLVSVTVDPETDTPKVLRNYAGRYGADPERWIFLTGEAAEIYRLAQDGFHLGAGPQPEFDPALHEGPFFHSRRVALVDGEGRVRGYYDGTDPLEIDRLARDLRRARW